MKKLFGLLLLVSLVAGMPVFVTATDATAFPDSFLLSVSDMFESEELLDIALSDPWIHSQIDLIEDEVQLRAMLEFRAEWDEQINATRGAGFAQNERRASVAKRNLTSYLPTNRAGNFYFPSDFGGLYTNEAGNAVLLVVGADISSVGAMNLRSVAYTYDILVREADFSFNEIMETMSFIERFYVRNPDHPAMSNVIMWSFATPENRVRVDLTEYTEEQKELFRSTVIDSPIIFFFNAEGASFNFPTAEHEQDLSADAHLISPASNDIHPGSGINIYRPNGTRADSASIGFRAIRNGVNGFVTVAHAISPTRSGTPLRYADVVQGRDRIGSVTFRQLNIIDSAFVESASYVSRLLAGIWIPNVGHPSHSTTTVDHRSAVGDTVHIQGVPAHGSNTHVTGTIARIISTTQIRLYDNYGNSFRITSGVLVAGPTDNRPTSPGQSGGTVVNSAFDLAGMLTATYQPGQQGRHYALYVQADAIISSLRLTLY
jgi:hypothetical protein